METGTPSVSVIMATYNGARYIRQSINSLLSQTHADFELIIADDCSTDDTPAILAGIGDKRLVVLRNERNLGVVGSRNRCFARARGRYVAMLDHDDLSRPTRLARQVAYLEAHPDTVLLGTAAHTLTDGKLALTNHPRVTTKLVIAWLLQVANPLMCASVMFRADAARRLDCFLREEYKYADDYDFYHRMAALGQIARLDEPLTVYRLHPANTFRHHEATMLGNAVNVLAPAYGKWFGDEAVAAAQAVVHHISAMRPVPDPATFDLLSRTFRRVTDVYLQASADDAAARDIIGTHARALWRRVVRGTARAGGVPSAALLAAGPAGFVPSATDRARIALGSMPGLADARRASWQAAPAALPKPARGRVFDTEYEPCPPEPALPPTLFVVVDTEAEFDWSQPFAHNLTSVSAMDDIERGQAIFDTYGLRPIYVVDYPIASQPRGYRPLRAILDRGGCTIGAHLHPWTTPPFEEDLSSRNSFPGNLPPALEAEKLARLISMIRANFGISPVFYKAGRYGFGPATAAALAAHGIKVDLSVLPGADLRDQGGPDFRSLQPVPYRIAGTDIVTMPMTRADIGLAPALGLPSIAQSRTLRGLRLPAVLSRLGIEETVTLTPEGMTAEEQIRLIRTLLRRGQRRFLLHYHSPSLSPGHTPYVRDPAAARAFTDKLLAVVQYFIEDIGGLAGHPQDLLQL